MAQSTLVLNLTPREQDRFHVRLQAGEFEFRSVAHARFSVRGEGIVATLYESGKLVIQGRNADAFVARFLEAPAADSAAGEGAPACAESLPTVGSDEAGKGDYFGPLVVAAVKLEAEDAERLARGGSLDSKQISDERVAQLAPAFQERFEHAVELLEPPEYNREHARRRNLNPMLADLHAQAIRRLAVPGDRVVIDRFAREELMEGCLADLDVRLEQFPRAERVPAVGAASVIARHVFLQRMRELSLEHAIDLHKGAGAPTDAAGRRFVKLHGVEALELVAKLHFKNTRKITG